MSRRTPRAKRILALGSLAFALTLAALGVASADPARVPKAMKASGIGQGPPPGRIAIPAEDVEAFERAHGGADRSEPDSGIQGGVVQQRSASQVEPPRTIALEPPEVVNHSTQFQFRDITERTPEETRSDAERRSAVEAYRQSLMKGAP